MLIDAMVAILFVLVAPRCASLPVSNIAFVLGTLAAWEMGLEAFWNAPKTSWPGCLFWPAMVVLTRVAVRWALRRARED